jgi:type VI secretion system secreted protein Hcp
MIRRHFSVVVSAGLLCLATSAFAAPAAFLKFEGVPGESQDRGHKDWVVIESFSHGATRWQQGQGSVSRAPEAPGSRGSGEISIGKTLDRASAKLFQACCNGTHFRNVTLEVPQRTEKGDRYLRYELRDCVVTSYSLNRGEGGMHRQAPMEHVSLNYTKIAWTWADSPAGLGRLSAPAMHEGKPKRY